MSFETPDNPFDGASAVLFDMDGTLVDTDIDFTAMKRDTMLFAKRYGMPEEETEPLDILAIVDMLTESMRVSLGNVESEKVRAEAFSMLEKHEVEPCRNARPVAFASTVLERLRLKGVRVGIVTRNCRRAVDLAMEVTGIGAEVVLTRDDVRATKPHPEHLIAAMERLGAQPAQGVMVGDHWMDVQGGKAAGMRTIGILRENRPDDFYSAVVPDMIICQIGELLPLIERLKG